MDHCGGLHERDDLLQLTALTGLTRLIVSGATGCTETVAVPLACHLQQLRHLALRFCDLQSDACLPAIGALSHLTYLDLSGHKELRDGDVRQLVPARALSVLKYKETFTDDAVASYWSNVLRRLPSDDGCQ